MKIFDKELLYWMKDKKWTTIDKNGNIILTDKVPERVKKSFEMWKDNVRKRA